MLRKYWLEILAVVTVVVFIGAFIATSMMMPDAEYAGSDTVGSGQISEITGTPEEEFEPLIPQWEPPSGEIESALFALLAAFGGIMVGYVFGLWSAQRKSVAVSAPETAPDVHV